MANTCWLRIRIMSLSGATCLSADCCFNEIMKFNFVLWAVVVVIIWLLDLQLPMQSVPITTKVVSSSPIHGQVYSLQLLCDKVFSDFRQVVGFLPVLWLKFSVTSDRSLVFSRYSGFLHQ
jgi:hypothetical protein